MANNRSLQQIKSLVSPVGKSHIVYLNSWSATYISVGQLRVMSIGFKLKSKMVVSKPTAHLSNCLF